MRTRFAFTFFVVMGCSGSSDAEPTAATDATPDSSTTTDSSATDSVAIDSMTTDSTATDSMMPPSETSTPSDEYVSGKVDGAVVNITKVLVTTFSSATLFTFSASQGTAGMAGYKFTRISVTNAIGTYDCKGFKAQIDYSTHEKGEAAARSTRGTCSVTVTKAMANKGDAIEATFTADQAAVDGGSTLYRWTDGKLRVIWR